MTSHTLKKESINFFNNDVTSQGADRDDMTNLTIKIGFVGITAVLLMCLMLFVFVVLS